MKACKDCSIEKPLSEFYFNRTGVQYASPYCKPCHNERTKNNRRLNPERYSFYSKNRKSDNRKKELAHRYGLTEIQYRELVRAALGECAICHCEYGVPHIDHDKITGKIRGVLCMQCNVAIGLLMHNPTILQNAIDYLTRHAEASE